MVWLATARNGVLLAAAVLILLCAAVAVGFFLGELNYLHNKGLVEGHKPTDAS